MADPIIANAVRVNVVLQNANNLPKDRYVNSFVFTGTPSPAVALAAAVTPLVRDFYNATSGAEGIGAWLGPQCSRATDASRVVWYDLGQAPVRTPHIEPFTLRGASASTGGSEPLPAEVALCLSLYTPLNTQRGRGRIYIGPLNQATDETGAGNDSHPTAAVLNSIAGAAARLADAAVSAGCSWQVLSRMAGNITEITHGFIDNAWDTQRRRGIAPSTRTGWVRGA